MILNEALVPSGRDIFITDDEVELPQTAPHSPACSHGNLMVANVSLNCQQIKSVVRALSSGNHGNQVSAAQ